MKIILDVPEATMGNALTAYFRVNRQVNRLQPKESLEVQEGANTFSVVKNNNSVRITIK